MSSVQSNGIRAIDADGDPAAATTSDPPRRGITAWREESLLV